MNEIDLLKHIIPTLKQRDDVAVGPGDDCAVLKINDHTLLLAAVDQVISDVHFFHQTTSPERAGAKLLKRNLSDIAAMGGTPLWALLALAAGKECNERWIKGFFAGIEKNAEIFNISLCGGDLSSLPANTANMVGSLTILGTVEPHKLCLRSQARAGQLLLITGDLGNTLNSEHHLDFVPRLAEGRFLAGTYTKCMMDISDGLLLDAERLAQASQIKIQINPAALPCRHGATPQQALSDGEDYELMFTIDPSQLESLQSEWPFDTKLSVIGNIIGADANSNNAQVELVEIKENNFNSKKGYVHFE